MISLFLQGVVADTHVCLVALNFAKANVAVLKLLTQRVGDLVITKRWWGPSVEQELLAYSKS